MNAETVEIGDKVNVNVQGGMKGTVFGVVRHRKVVTKILIERIKVRGQLIMASPDMVTWIDYGDSGITDGSR